MKRVDALKAFSQEHAELFEEYDRVFRKKLFSLRYELLEVIRKGFHELAMGVEKEKKECEYIYCFFLRHDMLEKKYVVYAQAVDKNYVIDQNPIEIAVDIQFLFEGIEELWNELLEKRRKYVWKVNEYDVNAMCLEKIVQCHWKITFLLRFLLRNEEYQKEIRQVINSPRKIVRWGEYRDYGEVVFICHDNDRKGKLKSDLLLSYRIPHILKSAYYNGETESKLDCQNKDFRYTVFINCRFSEIVFDHSDFTGSCFMNCSFEGCRFRRTVMHLVQFGHCRHINTDWEEADFYGVFCDDTDMDGLTEVRKNNIIKEEEEFNEAIFLYEPGQKTSGYYLPQGF